MNLTLYLLVAMLLGLGLFSGCQPADSVGDETDERAYRRGKSLLREDRKDEALQAFLSVISARPDAMESHLEAGLIYLNHLKDPLAAIYHFRNYLHLNPDGEHAGFVEELILTAQKDFVQSLPGQPFGEAVDRVNLMELVKELREENTVLKTQILEFKKELMNQESLFQQRLQSAQTARLENREVAPIVIPPPRSAQQDVPSEAPSTYTVQAGDTLSRISAKVYGVNSRWMDIFQANKDQLPSPNALKVGQVLRIP